MKDIRESLYEKYYSTFKNGEKRERFGFLHLKLWYNEKYLPLMKGVRRDAPVLDLGCGQVSCSGTYRHAASQTLQGLMSLGSRWKEQGHLD